MDYVFESPIHTGAVIGAARMKERKGFRCFRFSKSYNFAVPSLRQSHIFEVDIIHIS